MKIKRHHFDVYSATLPLFYVMKIFGSVPFVLVGKVGKRRLKFSVISTVYSLASFMIFTYFRFATLHGFLRDITGTEMLSTVMYSYFWGVCYYLLSYFLASVGVLNSSNAAKILNKLSEFDSVLGGMSPICFRSVRYVCIQLCLSLCYCIYIGVLFLSQEDLGVIPKVMINVDTVMIICFNITQINLILLLKQRFEFLNFKLLEFIHDHHNKTNEIVRHKRNSKGVSVSSKILRLTAITSSNQHLKNQIIFISSLHGRLCDVSDQFNYFYSVQTLLSVAISFIELTINAYIAFLRIIRLESGVYVSDWFQHLIWLEIYFYMANVSALAWSGSSAAQQVRERFQ
jgi:uncharacterized membrane protein (DUF485 family)